MFHHPYNPSGLMSHARNVFSLRSLITNVDVSHEGSLVFSELKMPAQLFKAGRLSLVVYSVHS